jgi:hypothetical protein
MNRWIRKVRKTVNKKACYSIRVVLALLLIIFTSVFDELPAYSYELIHSCELSHSSVSIQSPSASFLSSCVPVSAKKSIASQRFVRLAHPTSVLAIPAATNIVEPRFLHMSHEDDLENHDECYIY